jgi:hypothetical protein
MSLAQMRFAFSGLADEVHSKMTADASQGPFFAATVAVEFCL